VNLEVKTTEKDNVTFVTIGGEIDLYSSPQVRTVLMKHAQLQKPLIIIHLADVTYIDSSGVATFIETLQKVNQYGGRIALIGMVDDVREVFSLTRLDKVFEIHDDFNQVVGQVPS
jgi:anti-sigma B factor antagonist